MSDTEHQLKELLTKAFPQGFAIVGAEQHVLDYVHFMRKAGFEVTTQKGARSIRLSLWMGSPKSGVGLQVIRDIDLKYLIHTPPP